VLKRLGEAGSDARGDREDPSAKMPAVLEPVVGAERAQERLLERILGRAAAEPAAQEPEHGLLVLLVEGLERRDHGFHHPL